MGTSPGLGGGWSPECPGPEALGSPPTADQDRSRDFQTGAGPGRAGWPNRPVPAGPRGGASAGSGPQCRRSAGPAPAPPSPPRPRPQRLPNPGPARSPGERAPAGTPAAPRNPPGLCGARVRAELSSLLLSPLIRTHRTRTHPRVLLGAVPSFWGAPVQEGDEMEVPHATGKRVPGSGASIAPAGGLHLSCIWGVGVREGEAR